MKLTRMLLTESRHGVSSAPGVAATTTVLGLAAATALTSSLPLSSRLRDLRSLPSEDVVATNTTTTSMVLASAAAAAVSVPRSNRTHLPPTQSTAGGGLGGGAQLPETVPGLVVGLWRPCMKRQVGWKFLGTGMGLDGSQGGQLWRGGF
eukprot:COSAG04_NODE_2290_length_4380_cov_2.919411_4_plen_149_part_00